MAPLADSVDDEIANTARTLGEAPSPREVAAAELDGVVPLATAADLDRRLGRWEHSQ